MGRRVRTFVKSSQCPPELDLTSPSSGLGPLTFNQMIAGSNPVDVTKFGPRNCWEWLSRLHREDQVGSNPTGSTKVVVASKLDDRVGQAGNG
jgi:hypothetical protein